MCIRIQVYEEAELVEALMGVGGRGWLWGLGMGAG